MFDDYITIVSKAKYEAKHGKGRKTLTPKQMLQRLPIALAQVKAGNTSENFGKLKRSHKYVALSNLKIYYT